VAPGLLRASDAPVPVEAPDAGTPAAPFCGPGGSPEVAAALFSGQYDGGTPDGGTPDTGKSTGTPSGGTLDPPSIDVGGDQGFKIPIPMPALKTKETSHDNGPAHDSKLFERDTQQPEIRDDGPRDKKIDPIGDKLRPPPGPDMSPGAQKLDYAVQHPKPQPDAGVPAGGMPVIHRELRR